MFNDIDGRKRGRKRRVALSLMEPYQRNHYAEFNRTNMIRKYYWNLLMKKFGITPWDTTQTTPPVLP